MNRHVIVMRGISGSGKTTYLNEYYPHACRISTDDFFTDSDGNYRFDGRRLEEAHQRCEWKFKAALERGRSLIAVDNTNACIEHVRPWVELANEYGYDVTIITLMAYPKTGARDTVHGTPLETIERQYRRIMTAHHDFPRGWNHHVFEVD